MTKQTERKGWACTILVSQHYGLSGLNNCKEQTICNLKIRDRLVRSPLDVTRSFEEQEHDHDISSDAQKWASLLEGNPLRKVGNVEFPVPFDSDNSSSDSSSLSSSLMLDSVSGLTSSMSGQVEQRVFLCISRFRTSSVSFSNTSTGSFLTGTLSHQIFH
ncbi:Uncharacterized protein APZ42_024109 [Daphnia magna]|uniref:Uncharacterized protein n=1 Tax=Daphnia magna TaxID=35525 RepID=A0A162DGA8_9CRUS|nr:Uncharacterized protein APZ42_024109 [Daphnia magna]